MRPLTGPLLPSIPTLLAVLLAGGLLAGCGTSRSAEEVASDRAEVLGVWKYQANGTSVLQRGTLQIHERDGQLEAKFQDRRRGRVKASIFLENSHMAFNLDRVRISGRIRSDRFEGAIRQEYWDASQRRNSKSAQGYIVAQRVRTYAAAGNAADYGCPSVLWESSYTCSPLRPE